MTTKPSHSDLLSRLEEGIATLTSSDTWRHYLAFQSRFHRYSYGNALLIASQCGEATHVTGFHGWRALGRVVRRGEKAIWILAPMVVKQAESDASQEEGGVRGFKYVPVFDISQTDGDDPPAVCTKLSGPDRADAYLRFLAVADSIGFRVEDHQFDDATNGDCCSSERRIRIEQRNSPAQRVKTLVHELAHALLHPTVEDRALAELEAESTAYIVCDVVGIDTGDYSFGYVATWSGGGDEAISRIKASCGRIQKAAARILDSVADPAHETGRAA
jgi:antirestriction protein ArdC